MEFLTDEQIQRQDFVDNAIRDLFRQLNSSDIPLEWNMEAIGEVREVIRKWLVERLSLTDEMTFYPYLIED